MKFLSALVRTTALATLLSPALRGAEVLSNLDQTSTSPGLVSLFGWWGNRFTTGNTSSGYTLDSFTISFGNVADASGNFFVAVYDQSGNRPGSQIGSLLSGPSDPAPNANATYTASGISLAANTNYWLVVGVASGTGSYNWNSTSSTAFTSADNWSLPSTESYSGSDNQGTSWSFPVSNLRFQFSVSATAVPEPAHYVVLFAAAVLCLAAWKRRRLRPSSGQTGQAVS